MKTLNRYLMRDLIKPSLVALFIMLSVIWLMQSLRFMDLIINRGIDMGTFLWLTLLLVPSLLIVILPVSFFAGGCYTLKRMVDDSEADALFAAGISRLQLAKPGLKLAFMLVVLGYVISLWALPEGKNRFKEIQNNLRGAQSALLLEEGTFNPASDTLTIYIKSRDPDGTLHNIMVHERKNKDRPETWIAQEGRIRINEAGFPQLYLEGGARLEVNDEKLSTLAFDHYTMDVSRQMKMEGPRFKGAEERSMPELFDYDGLPEKFKNEFMAELQRRLIWPLTPIPLLLMALLSIVRLDKRRAGSGRTVVQASLLAASYQGLLMVANSMASDGNLIVLYAQWMLPVGATLACVAFMKWQEVRS
ncbi:MAG: LPS export ABC transporter permease LptF [Proteobacteria bacterium]|nr:LPS export ABC transporter permease LptF [Pseudomonadota bacterium]